MRAETTSGLVEERAKEKRGGERKRFADGGAQRSKLKIEEYKKKYNDQKKIPRPSYWSGWNLFPLSVEFWLDGDNRIHERLKYTRDSNDNWVKSLLSP